MTKQRDALARARAVIFDIRDQDFVSYTIGRDPATMDETEAEIIAEYDQALALIDAALAEPDAPGVERIAQLLIDSGDCDWEGAKAPCHPTACFCMKQARAVAALYGAPPDAGALLAAAKKAKDYLIRELQEPGRSAFWTLVEAIRSFDAASGKGGSQP